MKVTCPGAWVAGLTGIKRLISVQIVLDWPTGTEFGNIFEDSKHHPGCLLFSSVAIFYLFNPFPVCFLCIVV